MNLRNLIFRSYLIFFGHGTCHFAREGRVAGETAGSLEDGVKVMSRVEELRGDDPVLNFRILSDLDKSCLY